jgi:hypothetical protein
MFEKLFLSLWRRRHLVGSRSRIVGCFPSCSGQSVKKMRYSDSLILLWLYQVELARLLNGDRTKFGYPKLFNTCMRTPCQLDTCGFLWSENRSWYKYARAACLKTRFCHCGVDVAWRAVGHACLVVFLPCSGRSVKKERYSDSLILLWLHRG